MEVESELYNHVGREERRVWRRPFPLRSATSTESRMGLPGRLPLGEVGREGKLSEVGVCW